MEQSRLCRFGIVAAAAMVAWAVEGAAGSSYIVVSDESMELFAPVVERLTGR
jgi:hypothetical protein